MDQADVLRAKFAHSGEDQIKKLRTRTISITSGKGGVGKTSLSINLASKLAQQKLKVLLVDCDFGLANVDVMLNLKPQSTLEDLLAGKASISEVVVDSGYEFDVLPASSGIPEIADLHLEKQKYLIKELAAIQSFYDYLIFDTGSGLHKSILRINAAAEQIIIVTNPEPTAITDAYAMIKALRTLYKVQHFALVVMKSEPKQAEAIKNLLLDVGQKNGTIFDITLIGSLRSEQSVERAIYSRSLWHLMKNSSGATASLNEIAANLTGAEHKSPAVKTSSSFWSNWLNLGGSKNQ